MSGPFSAVCQTRALLGMLLTMLSPNRTEALTVTGVIKSTAVGKDGPPIWEVSCPFRASTGNGGWLISLDFGVDAYREECGGDGDFTYGITRFAEARIQQAIESKELIVGEGTAALPSAYVMRGDHPYFSDPVTRTIWLAFASNRYLATNQTKLPPVWSSSFQEPAGHAYVMRNVQLLSGSAGLPEHIGFELSAEGLQDLEHSLYLSTWVDSKAMETAGKQIRKFLKSGGRSEGAYQVRQTTNIFSRVIPTRFSLTMTDSQPRGGTMTTLTEGEVLSIEDLELAPVPALDQSVDVADYRFRAVHVDRINYVNSNRVWLSEDDPALQRLFLSQLASRRLETPSRQYPAFLVLIVALVLVAPVAWMKFRWRRRAGDSSGA